MYDKFLYFWHAVAIQAVVISIRKILLKFNLPGFANFMIQMIFGIKVYQLR